MANDNNLAEGLADGEGTPLTINRPASGNRETSVFVYGVFGGASVKVQVNPKKVSETAEWFDISGANWVIKGVKELILSATQVRVVVSGGDGTTAINAMIW